MERSCSSGISHHLEDRPFILRADSSALTWNSKPRCCGSLKVWVISATRALSCAMNSEVGCSRDCELQNLSRNFWWYGQTVAYVDFRMATAAFHVVTLSLMPFRHVDSSDSKTQEKDLRPSASFMLHPSL